MDYTFTSTDDAPGAEPETQTATSPTETGFSISTRPIVAAPTESGAQVDELPRSYGSDTLGLLARDPNSVFAYWDVDWSAAFGEAVPLERKVYLKLLRADGTEETEIEVQPLAGGRMLETTEENAGYRAELGYYDGAREWKPIARSLTVNTPPAAPVDELAGEFTTVPFHLSFQKMLDMLSGSDAQTTPLTTNLSELRARAEKQVGDFTAAQRELVRSIDELVANAPPPPPAERAPATVRWTHERLVRILGFGPTNPDRGFGGSSRSA